MKPLPDKHKIKDAIRDFFSSHQGQEFHGSDLLEYCLKTRDLRKQIYPDTVLRYMRELDAEEDITYKQVGGKSESKYKVLTTMKVKKETIRCNTCGHLHYEFTFVRCMGCGQDYEITPDADSCPKCGSGENVLICRKCKGIIRISGQVIDEKNFE